MPSATERVRKPAVTSARNGPIVQDSDANANAIPNPTAESRARVATTGRVRWIDRPATSSAPTTATASPTAIVTHGRTRWATVASGAASSPKAPNTATNPAVMAALVTRAPPSRFERPRSTSRFLRNAGL
jgi:hypothetical protein